VTGGFLAGDWGTTNLRCWVVGPDGAVGPTRDFPLGIAVVGRDAPRRFNDEVRPAMGATDLPALLCGMVGAELGWGGAGYQPCPAGIETMAGALVRVASQGEPVRIVPGLMCRRPSGEVDVMRGEETQLFGWLHLHPDRARGRQVVCHPGTHAKWALIEDGRLTRFVTAMTGELFAVLSKHSVLKSDASPDDDAAFDAGLAAAGEGDALAARLFTARTRVVGGGAPAESTPAYLSGLLIGADVAAVPRLLGVGADEPLALLGDERLCRLYGRALARRGVAFETFDGEAAAIAGLFALSGMAS
jgi:2-dehydro-3-deoxygalactonokinase